MRNCAWDNCGCHLAFPCAAGIPGCKFRSGSESGLEPCTENLSFCFRARLPSAQYSQHVPPSAERTASPSVPSPLLNGKCKGFHYVFSANNKIYRLRIEKRRHIDIKRIRMRAGKEKTATGWIRKQYISHFGSNFSSEQSAARWKNPPSKWHLVPHSPSLFSFR